MDKKFSGQLRLRMPTSLHRNLALRAANEGVSLNTLLLYLISKNYGEDIAGTSETARADKSIMLVGEFDSIYNSKSPTIFIDPLSPQQ